MLSLLAAVSSLDPTVPEWRLEPAAACSELRRRHVHEAGHLLCGTLVGLEVASYVVGGTGDGEATMSFEMEPGDAAVAPYGQHALQALAVAVQAPQAEAQ